MLLFLFSFFLIYGGVHLYAFLRARAAFKFGAGAGIAVALFMALMVSAPFIIRLLEKLGLDLLARAFSYVGYIWMGILFLFFSASLLIDAYNLIIRAAGHLAGGGPPLPVISQTLSFYVPLLLSIAVSFYGYFEALDIKTERVVIKTSKVPKSMGTLKIAQITDVHAGLIVREGRLGRIIKAVNDANPDMLVSTGDLMDGQMDGIVGLAELFREIKPRYGKFAVVGNHEYYAGLAQAIDFTERAGFKVLRGESVDFGFIGVAGVDDPQGKRYKLYRGLEESSILGFPKERFVLLLKHRPEVDEASVGRFDLQLSGHIHKGQIFPFRILTKIAYPYLSGMFDLGGGSKLYVSRGSGTWGPPIRFLSPPEVTIIEVVPEG